MIKALKLYGKGVDLTKSGERLGKLARSPRQLIAARHFDFIFKFEQFQHLVSLMGMTLLYFWALLPIALRSVKALPPPQEPLLPTESNPVASSAESANLPLVVWHGLGDKYFVPVSTLCHYTYSL